jgi:hypothetical protein
MAKVDGASWAMRALVPALLFAAAPAPLVIDLATVSSLCDALVAKINGLGLECALGARRL